MSTRKLVAASMTESFLCHLSAMDRLKQNHDVLLLLLLLSVQDHTMQQMRCVDSNQSNQIRRLDSVAVFRS